MKTFDNLDPLESSVELHTLKEDKNERLLGFDESFVITNEEGCISIQRWRILGMRVISLRG